MNAALQLLQYIKNIKQFVYLFVIQMKQCCTKWKSFFSQSNKHKHYFVVSEIVSNMKNLRLGQLRSLHSWYGFQKTLTHILNKSFTKQQIIRKKSYWKYFYNYGCSSRYQANLPFKSLLYQSKHQSYILAAVVCSFSWEENGISNEEMAEYVICFLLFLPLGKMRGIVIIMSSVVVVCRNFLVSSITRLNLINPILMKLHRIVLCG